MRILPQLFYQSPDVDKLLVDGLSCIIQKRVSAPVFRKEGYVSAHAVTMVLKGMLRVENDEGMVVDLISGQMIFLQKGLYMISDIVPDTEPFEALVLFFDEDVIRGFNTSNQIKTIKNKCSVCKVMEQTPAVRVFTESLIKLHQLGALNRGMTTVKLHEFLHLLSQSVNAECLVERLATLNNKPRRSIREFMLSNFSKPLSIEDYAYLTGRSVSSFRRDFIEQFGISPKQWLIERRLEMAHQLLSKNNTTVSQVALDIGYEDISHFIKAFRKKYGVPPKQFLMRTRRELLV